MTQEPSENKPKKRNLREISNALLDWYSEHELRHIEHSSKLQKLLIELEKAKK